MYKERPCSYFMLSMHQDTELWPQTVSGHKNTDCSNFIYILLKLNPGSLKQRPLKLLFVLPRHHFHAKRACRLKSEHHPPRLVCFFFFLYRLKFMYLRLHHCITFLPLVWEILHSFEAKLECKRFLHRPIISMMIVWLPFPAKNQISLNEENIPVTSRPASAAQIHKCSWLFLALIGGKKFIAQHIHSLPSSLAQAGKILGIISWRYVKLQKVSVRRILIFIPTAVFKFPTFPIEKIHTLG